MPLAVLLLAAAPAPIVGRWLTLDGKAMVEIAPCGEAVCGRIVRVLKPRPGGPAVDSANVDPAMRSRPMLGLTILSDVRADRDRWRGRIYNPETGRTYRSELTRNGETLNVKGCVGVLCRTQIWTAAPR